MGVVFLLIENEGGRTERRDAAGNGAYARGSGGTGAGEAARDIEAGEGADAVAGGDDDPNRVAGAPVTIRGRVVRDNQGVADATVLAVRARPWARSWVYSYARRTTKEAPPPIAKTKSADGGYFELTIPRRRVVVLRALRPGNAFASLRIFLPETGDPEDVTLRLRDARSLVGLVVDEKSEPVAGAPVRLTLSGYYTAPIQFEATTDNAGLVRFEDLATGSYVFVVEDKRYPTTSRSVAVPTTTHVRIMLGPGGVIAGTVAASDGTPVASARLHFRTTADGQGGVGEATTDATGAYRVENVLPGPVASVTLEHPAFGVLMTSRGAFTPPIQAVKAGEELAYDIRLEPGVPLRGRTVQADSGVPVPDATVVLLRMNDQWRGMTELGNVKSDKDGRFAFPFVAEGTYALEAKAAGFARLAVRYMQQQRPLTIDVYVDGESAAPEQRLEMTPMGAVRGKVLNYAFNGNQQRIGLMIQAETGNIQAQVDDRAHFLFETVPPMEGATVQSWNPQGKSDPFTVEAGETTEVELDAWKGGGFTGVVEDDQGNPIKDAIVQAMPDATLKSSLSNFLRQNVWGSARTDAEGRFFCAPLEWQRQNYGSGDWVVVARHDDYLFAMKRKLKLAKEGESTDVRITLAAGGAVSGRVEFDGGGPAPNVSVSMSPRKQGAPYETRTSLRTTTDFDGGFVLNGVGDGEYTLGAYYADGNVQWQTAKAGDSGVVLVITPAEHIEGVVVDEENKPVVRAQVSAIIPTAKGEQKRSSVTGQNGRFSIRHLDPGSYPLEVAPQARQGYQGQAGFEKTRVDPVATGTDDTVIVVKPGPRLEGLVRDARGRPRAGAAVIAMPLEIKKPKPGQRSQQHPRNAVRPSAITNGRGEFEIKGIESGEVELIVLAEGHLPTTRRAVAGEAGINIQLERGEEVAGRILGSDGLPLRNQWLSLQAQSPDVQQKMRDWQERAGQTWNHLGGWYMVSGRTDRDGKFRFGSLLPGEYKIYLSTERGVMPDTTLRTGEGSTTFRLLPALKIAGQVVDVNGSPIVPDGFRIYVNARQGQRYLRGAQVGSDGRFELKGMPPGAVTVQVWAGNRYRAANVEATAGDLNVRIVLEAVPLPPQKKKG